MSQPAPASPIVEKSVIAETWADARSGPALLLFTPCLHLLYMTPEASALNECLTRANVGAARGVIPMEVVTLCDEILAELRLRRDLKECEQVQIRRVVGESGSSVLLRGFGLPGPGGLQDARVLILMEAVASRKNATPPRAKERYSLTDREQAVLVALLTGLTSKEIATRLQVTEYTVKEHLKHLMRKTGTTTRTGLLAKILLTTTESPRDSSVPA